MYPLQWMGAVRMRVQTADKNITIIHTTPVHQLTSWEVKSCIFVRNKSIEAVSNYFCLKYESIDHNNTSSIEKVVWSESGEKSAQIKHRLQSKTVQNSSKQICGWILMWETTGDGLFHWRKHFYGLWTHILARRIWTHSCGFSRC